MLSTVHNAVCGSLVAMFLSVLAIPEPALAGGTVVTVRPPTIVRSTLRLPLNPKPDSNSPSSLLAGTNQMQETQMSFNLQYLQLQNTMQNDNRQYTMVGNIMKTKHNTAKNTIRNIH